MDATRTKRRSTLTDLVMANMGLMVRLPSGWIWRKENGWETYSRTVNSRWLGWVWVTKAMCTTRLSGFSDLQKVPAPPGS